MTHTSTVSPAKPGARRGWIQVAVWGIAAAVAAIALIVAIVARPTVDPDAPTLQPMEASESMTDEQAFAVADNTARVWMRERNEGHLANVEALSCANPGLGVMANEIDKLRRGDFLKAHDITATARLTREGPRWTIDVLRATGGSTFVLEVVDGELLVCRIVPAPVP